MRKMKVFNLQLHSPCDCLLNSIYIYGESSFPVFSLWKEVRVIWEKFLRVNTVLWRKELNELKFIKRHSKPPY